MSTSLGLEHGGGAGWCWLGCCSCECCGEGGVNSGGLGGGDGGMSGGMRRVVVTRRVRGG